MCIYHRSFFFFVIFVYDNTKKKCISSSDKNEKRKYSTELGKSFLILQALCQLLFRAFFLFRYERVFVSQSIN